MLQPVICTCICICVIHCYKHLTPTKTLTLDPDPRLLGLYSKRNSSTKQFVSDYPGFQNTQVVLIESTSGEQMIGSVVYTQYTDRFRQAIWHSKGMYWTYFVHTEYHDDALSSKSCIFFSLAQLVYFENVVRLNFVDKSPVDTAQVQHIHKDWRGIR